MSGKLLVIDNKDQVACIHLFADIPQGELAERRASASLPAHF